MARSTFEEFRDEIARRSVNGPEGWALVAGFDERGYVLMLQQAKNEREPMVRVGCRYFTLKQARAHYVSRGRNCNRSMRRTAAQMLMLIGLAVQSAKTKGLIARSYKFNTTPRKASNARTR